MNPDRYQRVKEVLAEALDLTGSSRAEFLRQACGADAELYDEVKSLLDHAVEDTFLEPLVRRETSTDNTPLDAPSSHHPATLFDADQLEGIRAVAVYPFRVANDGDADASGEAIAEALADLLNRHPGVMAARVPTEISERMSSKALTGFKFILAGTFSESLPTISVTIQLVDAQTCGLVGEISLAGAISGLPLLLKRVAAEILELVGDGEGSKAAEPVAARSSGNGNAYLSYLVGRLHLSRGTEAGFRDALRTFGRTEEGQPLTQAAIVESVVGILEIGCPADASTLTDRARSALNRACAIDANAQEVQFAVAEAAYSLDWSLDDAERALRRVLAEHPGCARAHLRLAECLIVKGSNVEAAREAQAASFRDPFSPRTLQRVGRIHHFAQDYARSAAAFMKSLERAPLSALARLDLAMTLAKLGAINDARAEWRRALQLEDGRALVVAVFGNAARARGQTTDYRGARSFLQQLAKESSLRTCCLKLLEMRFGDTDKPLEFFEHYDDSAGASKFAALILVRGSLSSMVPHIGLAAYLGIDPISEVLLDETPQIFLRGMVENSTS